MFFAYPSRAAFEEKIKKVGFEEYCFGFELSDIRPGVKEVNVTYMFPQDASLNTFEHFTNCHRRNHFGGIIIPQ